MGDKRCHRERNNGVGINPCVAKVARIDYGCTKMNPDSESEVKCSITRVKGIK